MTPVPEECFFERTVKKLFKSCYYTLVCFYILMYESHTVEIMVFEMVVM